MDKMLKTLVNKHGLRGVAAALVLLYGMRGVVNAIADGLEDLNEKGTPVPSEGDTVFPEDVDTAIANLRNYLY